VSPTPDFTTATPDDRQYPAPGYQQYAPPGYQYPPPGYQQYPPSGYQQYPPPGYQQYPSQSTNGLAIASMVLGILCLYGVGSILALVFGYSARKTIRESGGTQKGGGMAVAGIVLGYIGLVGVAILIAVFVSAHNSGNGS
jgi:hypothetical protein